MKSPIITFSPGINRLIVLIGLLFGAAQAGPGASAAGPALSGVLTVIWGDARGGQSSVAFFLDTPDGLRYELRLAAAPAADMWSLNGRQVIVYTTSDRARGAPPAVPLPVVRVVAADRRPADDRAAADDPLAGVLPYLSLLCAFPDGDGEFESMTFYRDMYGNDAPQLGHYWNGLSYGAVALDGSGAVGPFAMPHPAGFYGIDDFNEDLVGLANDCVAAADPNVDFSAYHGINLIFNLTEARWSVAYGGGWYGLIDGAERFIATSWLPTWAWKDLSVVEHEMGHTFGLPHSSGPYGNVYDNPYDVMSADRYPCYVHDQYDDTYGCVGQQTIGYHKQMLGWLAGDDIHTAGAGDDSVELDILSADDDGRPRLIVVPVIDNPDLFYTVEARATTGYDGGVPGAGVVIHQVDRGEVPSGAILQDGDGNGDTTDAGVYWEVGELFAAPDDGIAITVTAATAGGYEVAIHVSPPPPFTTCAAQTARLAFEECAALVALYHRTNGPEWIARDGWLALPNPCHWYGVGCERRVEADGPAYAMTELWLGHNGLQGTIPPELGDLSALHTLFLADNRLTGPLPAELGQLSKLTVLWLGGDNRLTGEIPAELGQLSELTSLAIYTNDLQAGLSGPIPEELSQLEGLEELDVSRQDLSGPMPAFLGRLTNLRYLVLDGNQFTGLLPTGWGDLANLENLNVMNNPLSGSIPHHYVDLDHLFGFYFQGTGLCQPPDAAFQSWLHGLPDSAVEDALCGTSLAGNYNDGAPGSVFALRGVVFPPDMAAAVAVNGRSIGHVRTNEFGEVSFLLDTEAAGEGRYEVSVEAGARAVFAIRLDDDRPPRPAAGEGPALAIPTGTTPLAELFVPVVARQ